MTRQTLYTDTDLFAGGASNLSAHATPKGNTWTAMNTQTGNLNLDGSGDVVYSAGSVVAFDAFYKVNLVDAAFPVLSNDEYQTLELILVTRAISARSFSIFGARFDSAYSSVSYGPSNRDLATATLQNCERAIMTNGVLTAPSISARAHITIKSIVEDVTITIRYDPYQTAVKYETVGIPNGIYNFVEFQSSGGLTSSRLVPGVVMFDSLPGTPALFRSFQFTYFRLLPLTLYPRWRDSGSTAVADTGLLSFTDAFEVIVPSSDEATVNVGGFDVVASKNSGDRPLRPYMLILDNRLNAGVVDVIIGPFRWRAAPFTEMEIPLSSALNLDLISLRGGGTGSRMRMFAHEVPKTFRQ